MGVQILLQIKKRTDKFDEGKVFQKLYSIQIDLTYSHNFFYPLYL